METLKVKAVFLDFDDTLQSRKDAYRLYCERFLQRYFPYDSRTERENKLYEMEALVEGGYKPREEYFPQLIKLWQWKNHPPLQELYDSFNLEYGKRVVMLPGAVETVRELKRRGYILGMITNGNSDLQNMKLDTAGLREYFDVSVVSGDIGIHKPSVGIFREALRRAGVRPDEAVFIGDHPKNDIQGALGAGMHAIRMNYGDFYGRDLNIADVPVIENISDALNYLPPLPSAAPLKKVSKSPVSKTRDEKSKRKNALFVKVVAVLCAVMMIALAVIGSVTDVFDEDSSEKTILFTSLKSDKKAELQELLNKYSVFFENGYDFQKENFDIILENLLPKSDGGLYKNFVTEPEVFTESADPAGRFVFGNGNEGFVKLEKREMEKIADGLSQTVLTDANSRREYYFNGNYYIALSSTEKIVQKLYAVIDSSAEVSSGGYYITCRIFDDPNALSSPGDYVEKYLRYCLVDCTEVGGERNWSLKKISTEPLFSKTGAKLEESNENDSLNYTFRRKTMKATTSEGKVFAVYFIEYPVFKEDGIAQSACESVYSEKIDEFRTKVANADSFYDAYIADGGDESLLPMTTNVVVKVTYNSDGYISLIDRTTIFDPTPAKSRQDETAATDETETTEAETSEESAFENGEGTTSENAGELTTSFDGTDVTDPESGDNSSTEPDVVLPKVQYVGYTFEIENGSFVKKDELTGADSTAFSQKLREKYESVYGHGSGLESGFDKFGNPISTSTVGADIYNSSWSITPEGMDFYYIDSDDLLSLVTVGWDELTSRRILLN